MSRATSNIDSILRLGLMVLDHILGDDPCILSMEPKDQRQLSRLWIIKSLWIIRFCVWIVRSFAVEA